MGEDIDVQDRRKVFSTFVDRVKLVELCKDNTTDRFLP